MTDQQTAALVRAAGRLRRRQQGRATTCPEADARRQRLDRAVRAGRLALLERRTGATGGAADRSDAAW